MAEIRLFETCLVEQFMPEASAAVATILGRLRFTVTWLKDTFCCGQMAFNEGFRTEARNLARRFLDSCEPGAPVILPSGSCTAMVRVYYPDLFADDPATAQRAASLSPWVFEFSEFLSRVLKVEDLGARYEKSVAYHPSCHSLRELGVCQGARNLLRAVRGLRLCEVANATECCGFGGLFCVKFPEISTAMLNDKLDAIAKSGAEIVTSNDAGCLLHLGGALHRRKAKIEVRHLAEILAHR